MTYREIISDIKNNKIAPVYVLMGEEPFYINLISQALEKNVITEEEDRIFDQNILYGADTQIDFIVETANRFPVLAERQLVMLKEAQAMPKAKTELDKLKSYIEKPNAATVLVIIYKGDKLTATSAFMKAVKNNKNVIVFNSPAIKEYQLSPIIKDYCLAENIKISDKAVALLIEHVGSSLEKIYSDIEKLIVAQKGDRNITIESIEKNIGINKDYNNFELLAALRNRNYYGSMRIVKYFAENPKSNPSIVTTAVLFSFFQKLMIALSLNDMSDSSLMSELQLKSSYALTDFKVALRNYNFLQCEKIIHAIREFDTKSKGINSYQKEYDLLRELIFNILTV